MFCRTDISIGLPRHLLWSLITDASARHLWQQDIISANLESGYGGGKGSRITLEAKAGSSAIKVTEHVIRSRVQDSLVAVQSWPKYQIHNKYILTVESEESTNLTLQKRYKGQVRFSLLGKQMTRQELEASALQELVGLKNLSAQLHNRMAEQSLPAGEETAK